MSYYEDFDPAILSSGGDVDVGSMLRRRKNIPLRDASQCRCRAVKVRKQNKTHQSSNTNKTKSEYIFELHVAGEPRRFLWMTSAAEIV